MKRTATGKNNISLTIRVPVDEAIRIIGRLWAKGIMNDKQYIRRLQELDANESLKFAEKRLKLQKMIF